MEAATSRIDKDSDGKFFFIQGEVTVRVHEDSILKTIDEVDKLNAGAWVALANLNGFPTDPFNRVLLRPVLMGVLQEAWYEKFGENGVPEKCILNQQKRVEKYLEDVEKMKNAPETLPGAGGARAPGVKRVGRSYRLTIKGKPVWEKFKGQKGLIAESMVSMGAFDGKGGVSATTLADAIKDKLQTRQPAERVVAFYVNVFIKEGIFEVVGGTSADDSADEQEPEEEEQTPEPEPEPKKKSAKKGK